MTMFSQKPRFNLADFLTKPATADAKRMASADRQRRWQYIRPASLDNPAMEQEAKPGGKK